MENASKALIMAGSTIIAVLVLGVFVFLFTIGSTFGENYENKKQSEAVAKFNSRFEAYQRDYDFSSDESYNYNTISDVITVANLAYNINKQNDWDEKNSVTIEVDIEGVVLTILPDGNKMKQNKFLRESTGTTVDFYDLMNKPISAVLTGLPMAYYVDPDYIEAKLTDVNDNVGIKTQKRQYRYYFIVDENGIGHNLVTKLVNRVTFKLVENPAYNNII